MQATILICLDVNKIQQLSLSLSLWYICTCRTQRLKGQKSSRFHIKCIYKLILLLCFDIYFTWQLIADGPETVKIKLFFWSYNLLAECPMFSSRIVDYWAGVILFVCICLYFGPCFCHLIFSLWILPATIGSHHLNVAWEMLLEKKKRNVCRRAEDWRTRRLEVVLGCVAAWFMDTFEVSSLLPHGRPAAFQASTFSWQRGDGELMTPGSPAFHKCTAHICASWLCGNSSAGVWFSTCDWKKEKKKKKMMTKTSCQCSRGHVTHSLVTISEVIANRESEKEEK